MLDTGAAHGSEGDALIEGDEAAAVFYRQREQMQIGDLVVAVHAVDVDGSVIAQGDIVGPEFMIEGVAGMTKCLRAPSTHARVPR